MCLYVQSVPLPLRKPPFPFSVHGACSLVHMWIPTSGQDKIHFSAPGLLDQGRACDHSQDNEKPPENFLPKVSGNRKSLLS